MKMVKSLLLGSAAGLVAVAGAQAADLPVKAKPVEYVKVCSLYGAGFWYVPGTDTCLKIGSYLRVQTAWDAEGGGIPTGFNDGGTQGHFDRTDTSELAMRVRASISVDLRTQTEYGTLRSYLEIGQQLTTASAATVDSPFFDRGFIQFAGFTAGKIRSYFDINSFAPYSYANSRVSGDTGAAGIYGIAYTAQFGNGLTGSLSFEDGGSQSNGNLAGGAGSRGHLDVNLSMASQFGLGTVSYDNNGWVFPDVVGALRVDQAWGYAQIAAALHNASGGYYQTGGTALAAGIEANGHPGDKWGWAVTGGFTLNDVFGMKGDQVGLQVTYSQGAAGYATRAAGGSAIYGSGHSVGLNWVSDGTFTTGSGIELTSVWSVGGFYQHFWNPKWRTSLHGGYVEVDYDSTAASAMCVQTGALTGSLTSAIGVAAGPGATNCNPNSSWWSVGTRTQWNPHPDLDIGVEVLYNHLNTAFAGTAVLPANGARTGGIYAVEDQNVLSVLFRVQRNFLP